MQRTALALLLAMTSCYRREPLDESSREPDDDAALAAARDGFAYADEIVPPPAVGKTLPLLRITRPDREPDDLERRLAAVLHAMELDAQQQSITAWAAAASSATEPEVTEIGHDVVVVYDRELDDLMVVNNALLDMGHRGPGASDDALVAAGQRVLDDLIAAAIVDSSVSLDASDAAIIRSGSVGPDGEHEEWVDEILFDANENVEGIALADSKLRIGITPVGKVSSVQVADVEVENAGRVTIARTVDDIENAFAAYVAEMTPGAELVHVSARLPAYILYSDVSTGLVEPRYLVVYSVESGSGEGTVTSRAVITAWGLTDPTPTVEVWP